MSRHYYRRLCKAVSKNNMDEVNFLLNVDKVDPNPAAHYKTSPLWIACKNNNLEIVKLLITNQFNPADPNIPNKDGINPFEDAIGIPRKIDLVRLLITESRLAVNVNLTWNGGISFLFIAVHTKHVTLVKMLLKAGANPNFAGNRHKLPIQYAVDFGNLQIAQLLLQYGADLKPCLNILLENAALGYNYDVLEFLLQHAHNKDLLCACTSSLVGTGILCRDVPYFHRLRCWGFFTNDSVSSDNWCVFKFAIAMDMTTCTALKMLVEVVPQCLQGSWTCPNCERFPAELLEARKHPIRLDILCRSKIIQQMGFKAISKVETLPLPRLLKDFVQFKNSR